MARPSESRSHSIGGAMPPGIRVATGTWRGQKCRGTTTGIAPFRHVPSVVARAPNAGPTEHIAMLENCTKLTTLWMYYFCMLCCSMIEHFALVRLFGTKQQPTDTHTHTPLSLAHLTPGGGPAMGRRRAGRRAGSGPGSCPSTCLLPFARRKVTHQRSPR